MALYRCYFLDAADHVFGPPEIVNAPDDDTALKDAQALCDDHPVCANAEVWLDARRVGKLARTRRISN